MTRAQLRDLPIETLRALARAEQDEADRLQAAAAERQRTAARIRKEIKTRARARLRSSPETQEAPRAPCW